MTSTGSSVLASTAWVTPRERASSSFAGTTSTATTGHAPHTRAPMRQLRPTPPSPKTATLAPGGTRAVLRTAPTPVRTAHPKSAARSVTGVGGGVEEDPGRIGPRSGVAQSRTPRGAERAAAARGNVGEHHVIAGPH